MFHQIGTHCWCFSAIVYLPFLIMLRMLLKSWTDSVSLYLYIVYLLNIYHFHFILLYFIELIFVCCSLYLVLCFHFSLLSPYCTHLM